MDKRGVVNKQFQTIITLIIIASILAVLLSFIIGSGSGELIKKQVLAKELCLLVTEARPGTVINISSDKIIEKKESGFLIKKSSIDAGYYYPCYNKNVDIYKEEKNTLIIIK